MGPGVAGLAAAAPPRRALGGGHGGCRGNRDRCSTPGPVTRPVTSSVPPPTSGKRTVTVAPCSGLPAVRPTQVVANGATTPSGAHPNVSTPAVVGRNTRGVPPGAAFAGPTALSRKAPEPLSVQVPATPPLTVQVCPGCVRTARPSAR